MDKKSVSGKVKEKTFCSKCGSKIILVVMPKDKFQEEGRFEKLEDDWVRDNLLDFDWSPSSKREMTWEEAKDYCTRAGGRLPSFQEFVSIVDYSIDSPSISKVYFPNTFSSYYWSDTEYSAANAWFVNFSSGSAGYYYKTTSYYVRAVRASQ